MESFRQDFSSGLHPRWNRYVMGSGSLEQTERSLLLKLGGASARLYSDAQIDDYQGLPRRRFPWRSPLTLTVRARFSHPQGELKGTAGFGFWNDPFVMTGGRLMPALPKAIWFFYASPPSNMRLDIRAPGNGWKAATLDATRLPFLSLIPTAPLAIPLMNLRPLYRALWPLAQRAAGIGEAAVEAEMTHWHTYCLRWGEDEALFQVDGHEVLRYSVSPQGPLGFVMWMDNQYAVVTPWGRFAWGLMEVSGDQWMEVESLAIEKG